MDQSWIADAHNHLQDFNESIPEILKRNQQVKYLVVNSTNMDYLPNILLEQSPQIIPCIGLHPWFIPGNIPENYFDKMETILKENQRTQIGEIGLDFLKGKDQKKLQIELFQKQLLLAVKYQRTISVHCVRAQGEMLKLMKKFFTQYPQFKESIIMHSYGGSKEITESLNKSYNNFYYSLSMSSLKRVEILDYIPLEKLLLETDSPYQFYNLNDDELDVYEYQIGDSKIKVSEPRFIFQMIDVVSQYLKIERNVLQGKLMQNFLRAFNKFL